MNAPGQDGQSSDRWMALADRVLEGRTLSQAEGLAVLRSPDVDLPTLLAAAFRVRRQHFGLGVQLYYLKNAKSGLCPEDCGYCSQSIVSTAEIDRYSLLDEDVVMEGARQAYETNSGTYCIAASGRGPSSSEIQRVAGIVGKIKAKYPLHVCCSLGLLEPEQASALKQAGVDRINHNLNTSRRFHPNICTTHTYEDRLKTLQTVRAAGLEICCGVIVGMGEKDEDVVDVAMVLQKLGVDSIPVNFLNPIPGTPLEGVRLLNPRYCLKTLCLFRLTNPKTEVRIAGGREVNLRSMQPLGLYAANSIFVSDYLTTKGQAAEQDLQMIEDLGFQVESRESRVEG